MKNSDRKNAEIVNTFKRTKSLYHLRSELRGRLGIPRTRSSDGDRSQSKYASITPRISMTMPRGFDAFAQNLTDSHKFKTCVEGAKANDFTGALM